MTLVTSSGQSQKQFAQQTECFSAVPGVVDLKLILLYFKINRLQYIFIYGRNLLGTTSRETIYDHVSKNLVFLSQLERIL